MPLHALYTITVFITMCIAPHLSCEIMDITSLGQLQKKVSCCCQLLSEIPSINDTKHVTSLHLNRNKIKTLGNLSFTGYGDVEFINLDKNQIETIEDSAFHHLNRLRDLQLSRNKLTVISRFVLSNCSSIEKLNLSHNMFPRLSPEYPFLVSPTLTSLDLSYCELKHIPPNAFSELLRLSHIYLNNNNLTSLNWMTFEKLINLETVVMHDNPWNCTCELQDVVVMFREKKISLTPPEIFCSLRNEKREITSIIRDKSCLSEEVMTVQEPAVSVNSEQTSTAAHTQPTFASQTHEIISKQDYSNLTLNVNNLEQIIKQLRKEINYLRNKVDNASKQQNFNSAISVCSIFFSIGLILVFFKNKNKDAIKKQSQEFPTRGDNSFEEKKLATS